MDTDLVLHTIRLKSRKNREQRKLLDGVFGDSSKHYVVGKALAEEFGAKTVVVQGSIQDFLQWIIDNSDAIIAFIEKIIALFSASEGKSKP